MHQENGTPKEMRTSVAQLVTKLREQGIRLWVEDEQLRYRAPKNRLTPELRTELVARKEEVLEFLSQVQLGGELTPILPAPRDRALPLSFAQQRLWFLEQLGDTGTAYNLWNVFRLDGLLDVAMLHRCINELVRRHEILRTTFHEVDGQPVQVIAPQLELPLPVVSLDQPTPEARQAELHRQINADAQEPFDLAVGPLLRVTLFKLSEREHVLAIIIHHIITDAWSDRIILAELFEMASAFSQGMPSPLPELAIQYADYAIWQRGWLQGERLEQEVDYWRKQLAGAPDLLELPTDRTRPPIQSYNGAVEEVMLDPQLLQRLNDLSKKAGTTLFMTLLAGFALLLAKHSRQDDILVGSPVANRGRTEIEPLIGFFVNTLVLRVDLADNPTFVELLERVRQMTLSAFSHQELPFETLVEALSPTRSMSHNPFFQVVFSLQNIAPAEDAADEASEETSAISAAHGQATEDDLQLTFANDEIDEVTAKFDLMLTVTEAPTGLHCSWEYNTDLFEQATIQRMTEQMERLLEQVTTEPDQPLSQVDLLNATEKSHLLAAGAQKKHYEVTHTLHQRFEAQVAKHPESIAVTCGGESLTYAELNHQANQVAHRLQRLGAEAETRVGLCMERSLDMVVGVLAILKAGGAYVPLDPAYPESRIAYTLEDAEISILLTQGLLAEGFTGDAYANVPQLALLCLDDESLANEPDSNLNGTVRPDMLAYIIYTSGSTGNPKGVMVEHQQVMRLFSATDANYGFGADDVWTLFHSIAFDFSVWELWGALLYGGRLVVVPYWVSRSPEDFYQLLISEGVTVLNQTPSAFNSLQAMDKVAYESGQHESGQHQSSKSEALSLRWIIFGGEALALENLRGWFERRSHLEQSHQSRLVNMYGITETTVHVTYREITQADVEAGKGSLIGQPIGDLSLYILDEAMRPAPLGVAGELYVGGAGVARGYLNRPELTEERFIQIDDYRLTIDDSRLYRTGDLARRLPDGDVEYLGRLDHQVKIRGFRIELGEIEAALTNHEQVAECRVLAVEAEASSGRGDTRLIAYLIPAPYGDGVEDEFEKGAEDKSEDVGTDSAVGEDESVVDMSATESELIAQLRTHLHNLLPDYMVPAGFVLLDAMPLTPNGKLHRKALIALADATVGSTVEYVAPRTPVEETLAELWQEGLDMEQVGIYDDFFELGGHSLLATQLISAIRTELETELPLRTLFESPTVAGLAQAIEQQGRRVVASPLVAVERSETMPLSFAQQRLWFLQQLEEDSSAYNMHAALRMAGPLQVDRLERSLSIVMERHEILRTNFPALSGEPIQRIAEPTPVTLPLVDLRTLPQEAREEAALTHAAQEAEETFDLTTGPLIRFKLLQLAEEEHVLLVTLHHIIGDDWSTGILFGEINALYGSLLDGEATEHGDQLPELPIQYADFAVWQREWLQGEVLQEQLDYWTTHLQGAPNLLELPSDRPRPAIQSFEGQTAVYPLNATVVEPLRAFCRRHGLTENMTLLAAFAILMARYSNSQDLVIGTPVANRNRSEIEPLIGFFVNTLALRFQLTPDASFLDFIEQVRQTTLNGYDHQDLPFEQVVEALQPQRSLSYTPLFQVMFDLLERDSGDAELAGLATGELNNQDTTAKFDLTLSVESHPDGMNGEWEFNTDLFDAATIAQMATHFEQLIGALIDEPTCPILTIPYLSEQERNQLLYGWNETGLTYDEERFVHTLIAERAAETPDEIAVVLTGEELGSQTTGENSQDTRPPECLTYAQLNGQANQLASYLVEVGVGPGTIVGLSMERSTELVVAILGVMKSGGAYLPLDPNLPGKRLSQILQDAKPYLVLNNSDVNKILAFTHSEEVEEQVIAQQPILPETLAYVIFTSGSTGKPKGVMVSHGNLLNAYRGWEDAYELDQVSSHLQMANFAFDVFTGDFVRALCSGGKLVLCPRDTLLDPALLFSLIQQEHIDCAEFVPAVLRGLMQHVANLKQDLAQLRLIIAGSDSWYGEEYRRFLTLCGPQTRLINSYGLTEVTIDSSYFEVNDGNDAANRTYLADGATLPIGRAYPNQQLYILDSQLSSAPFESTLIENGRNIEPVPVGVTGELYIGGRGVSLGYLNNPDLTDQRFIDNPFRPGEYLYKTGDGARWLRDGNVEFLGRLDTQVKVRGFRVELGEIEMVLVQHELVREAAVALKEVAPGNQQLVGYVVLTDAGETAEEGSARQDISSQLKQHLRERLPDYMVPNGYVTIDSIPLSANGKVDRRRLATPEMDMIGMDNGGMAYVAPRNAAEARLSEIWAEVLHVEQVGIEHNFFDLGGHSLLATQIISRVREHFDVDVALRTLFQASTIKEFALVVTTAQSAASRPPLVPISREDALPLSFAQQRLWFLEQLEGPSATYNMPSSVRLPEALDMALFEQCIHDLVARHEALRTSFIEVDGVPLQQIASVDSFQLPFSVVDLSQEEESKQEAIIHARINQEAEEPFDLTTGPLLRVTLLKLADEDYVLSLVMHHIISDGWSLDIFVEELSQLYLAHSQGLQSSLPALPVQYADYAIWQRTWLQGETLAEELAYWQEQLAGAPSLLELPTDHPRPPVQTFNGAALEFQLSTQVTEGLTQLARSNNATLFATLMAAYVALLHRYSGQEDIVIGAPTANRNRAEIEQLIGFFVNTLALRTDLSDNPSFTTLVHRVNETLLDAQMHQDVPFEQVVEAVDPVRSMSYTPLFQVMFDFENAAKSAWNQVDGQDEGDAESAYQSLELEQVAAKFDLILSLAEAENGFIGSWTFNTDLFEAKTMVRMNQHFARLLDAAVAQPDSPLSQLTLLGEEEERQILGEWNANTTAYPREESVAALFGETAAQYSDQVALRLGEESMTYSQLDQRTNQMAHYLIRQGVTPGQPVGFCLERSLEMVVTILAIVKAGGVYVPLDADYPADRLRFMLDDTGAKLLLTQRSLASELPESEANLLLLEEIWPEIEDVSPAGLTNHAGGDSLLYIMYTSGSTGQPKGVAVPHRGAVRLVRETDYMIIDQEQVFLQLAPISFDAATLELWGPLLNGGKLVLMPAGQPTLAEIGNTLVEQGVTALWLTSGLFNLMVEEQLDALSQVQQVLAGGDVLSPRHVKMLLEAQAKRPGQQWVINGYGPTENTTFTCCHPMSNVADMGGGTIPIGRPIANTTVYVLDAEMNPVPVGVAGELYIGGDGLAQGYWQREELTEERFVQVGKWASGQVGKSDDVEPAKPQPFNLSTVLYKTGDLVRWRADGSIEFMGRLDHQVKIRGFRIELGEIEKSLAQHEAVQENLVLAVDDPQGNKRLVGYIVTASGQVASGQVADFDPAQLVNGQNELVDELRTHLRSQLPDYMVPSGFVLLDEMPLTANGKMNRAVLIGLADEIVGSSVEYVSPRTSVEEQLVTLWQEILDVERIGIHDNFFELGGHSLLATQLVSHIRSEMALELPLRALFEGPTVAELAKTMSLAEAGALVTAPPITWVEERENLPLSYAQQRLWFLDQLEGPSATYNVPLAVTISSELDNQAFEHAIAKVVSRHEALRTTFATQDGEPVQQIHEQISIPLQVESFGHLPQHEQTSAVEEALARISQQPFDLASGPLLRVHLLQTSPEMGLLVIVMHHIISDGWSLTRFMEEVGLLYDLYSSDEAGLDRSPEYVDSLLPDLPVQYADFAVWQRNWLQGNVLDEALAYWRKQLAGAPELLEVPTDRPRPAIQTFEGRVVDFILDAELTQGLQILTQCSGGTLFMTLLAAYSTLLGKYSRQDDITVGTPIANRNRAEIEPLIGFFVNTLVMRADLSEDPTFEALLAQVQQTALDGYRYQDVPFEQVVDALDPVRSMSYSPLFQHFFVLQNFVSPNGADVVEGNDSGTDGGLTIDSVEEATHTVAKFDTTLSISESTTGELLCAWEYNTDLFDETTIRRMIGHFTQLLRSVVAEPAARLSALAMLEEEERNALLEAGQKKAHFNVTDALHSLVEQQVDAHPSQVAVTYEDNSLTYAELNQRANQVAHRLLKMGVTPESHVGLCLERSIDMVVGVLAILKAGGAYVPLDPASPKARLDYIMDDAGISVLLTQEELTESLPKQEQIQRLLMQDETLSSEPTDNPNLAVSPEHLAYIIYTSGSTGQPKGVMVEHQQVVRLFTATEGLYGFNDQDVWTLFHSIAFDFSVWELWGPLLYGGRLVVVPYWVSRSPEDFYELLIQEQVTVLNQTPSAFNSLQAADLAAHGVGAEEQNSLATNSPAIHVTYTNGSHANGLQDTDNQPTVNRPNLLSLRWIIFGGEALTLENLRGWFQRHGDKTPQLVNMYGITETTVHVTYRIITQEDVDAGRGSLIGQPISDLALFILDEEMNPVPMGVAGELHVGGDGVARGYHNRPELTAERFVSGHLTHDEVGSRLYKSGDLARRLVDGDIEYLGRIDHQVKIRGFRIELGEIENALLDYRYVGEASVLAIDDEQDDAGLVAYVVPQLNIEEDVTVDMAVAELPDEIDETTAVSMLRDHLRERLPEYMVPAGFVLLEEMPLTNNGKLDRRALVQMIDGVVGSSVEYVAPRTPTEEQLVAIWQEVLEVERIGIYDNFFDLGGHSLLVTRVASRIRSELEVELPLRILFEGPTVAEVAEEVVNSQLSAIDEELLDEELLAELLAGLDDEATEEELNTESDVELSQLLREEGQSS